MTLGTWVVGLGAVAAVVALAWPRGRDAALRAHVALTLAALAWLATDFLAGTLRHAYVWAHTRVDDPWYYRLSGVWGGEEGTIVLWAGVVALAALFVWRKRDPLDRRAALLLVSFSGALLAFTLLFGTFDATTPEQLARAPRGRGLADILLTPLMVIHPPVQFVGYGLIAVPAAYAVASLWSAEGGAWAGHAYPWARRAWLFATLGLALGALWAYYVLSFGGYWAWDPVETSNLLPWLALTAFLHAGKQRMRGQGHAAASLVLAYGAFLLTLFATFATRSGLWVSVHAFTDPTQRFEPDAAARLLAILDVHAPTRAFLGLLGAALFAGVGLHLLRGAHGVARYERYHGAALLVLAGAALLAPRDVWGATFWLATLATPLPVGLGILLGLLVGLPFVLRYARDDTHPPMRLDVRTLMAAATVLLGIALGVTFLLNAQVVNGPDRAVFDARAPFVALPIASTLTLMLALAPLGKRGALLLTLGALAASIASWALLRTVFALALPVCAAAALAAVLKLAHVQGSSAPRRLRVAGALLLLSAILGLVQWSNPPTYVAGRALGDDASLALGAAGLALSTLALLGAVAAFRARGRGLALAGGVAGALALGYGLGALLALAALAATAGQAFARGFWARERPRVRETGIYLVHLAVALGLLGYAASTYVQEREVFPATPLGATVDVGDYAVTLGDPTGAASDGRIDALRIPLALAKDGEPAGGASLDFTWQPRDGVYAGRLEVRRALAEDVYVTPMAFHTPDGWVGADSAAGGRAAASGVDMVTFSVSVLPLMSLVWASAWMMVLGMGLVLAATRREA